VVSGSLRRLRRRAGLVHPAADTLEHFKSEMLQSCKEYARGMEIKRNWQGSFLVLGLTGELDAETAPGFEAEADKLLEEGARFVVLDMSELAFISSAGLRAVLTLAKELRAVRGEVRFAALQKTVAEVFAMAGFNRLFGIFQDVAAALAKTV
jgi:anti-anti-sigma factor